MQSRSDDMQSDNMQDVGVWDATRWSQINWTRIICQTDTDEPLQCPADSKWCGARAGYQPFAEILPKFQAADALPSHVDLTDFDEGSGVLQCNAVCAQC